MTDATGLIVTAESFDPFGNPISPTGNSGSIYDYAGQQTDASGLQYLRARYYSPATGRFITRDPFPGVLTNPSTLNAYPYAVNNPILMSDPSGKTLLLLGIKYFDAHFSIVDYQDR
jgi:RHS repeat-associated protein